MQPPLRRVRPLVEFKKWNQIKSTVLKNLWTRSDFDLVFILSKLFKAKDLRLRFSIALSQMINGAETVEDQINKIERTYKIAVRHKKNYSIHWDMEQWIELNKMFKSHGLNEYS